MVAPGAELVNAANTAGSDSSSVPVWHDAPRNERDLGYQRLMDRYPGQSSLQVGICTAIDIAGIGRCFGQIERAEKDLGESLEV